MRPLKIRCQASPLLWCALILASAVFFSLSYWQLAKGLERQAKDAAQKALLEKAGELSLSQAISQWQINPVAINDLKITVTGTFTNMLIFHDNRIHNARAGYGTYGVLELEGPLSGQSMLINLGWHPAPLHDRALIPSLEIPKKSLSFSVLLEHIYSNVFTLDTLGIETLASDRFRVQKLQFDELTETLKTPLLPFVGRSLAVLTEPALKPLTAPLAKRGISANKHFGYSLQWFLFWCIALGVFVYTQCSWYATQSFRP